MIRSLQGSHYCPGMERGDFVVLDLEECEQHESDSTDEKTTASDPKEEGNRDKYNVYSSFNPYSFNIKQPAVPFHLSKVFDGNIRDRGEQTVYTRKRKRRTAHQVDSYGQLGASTLATVMRKMSDVPYTLEVTVNGERCKFVSGQFDPMLSSTEYRVPPHFNATDDMTSRPRSLARILDMIENHPDTVKHLNPK